MVIFLKTAISTTTYQINNPRALIPLKDFPGIIYTQFNKRKNMQEASKILILPKALISSIKKIIKMEED